MDRVEGRPNRTRNITGQHVSDPRSTAKSLLDILLGLLKLVAAEHLDAGEKRSPFSQDSSAEGK